MKYLVTFVIVFTACSSPFQKKRDPWNGFHPDVLERAWKDGDSVVVNNWIASLSDTSLPDWKFYGRVAELSNVTGFCYGNADPSEKSYYENIPQNERRIHKRNVAKVYLCYRKSCLFMKKATWDEALPLQDRYWNDTADIDSRELKMISKALDSICLKLKPDVNVSAYLIYDDGTLSNFDVLNDKSVLLWNTIIGAGDALKPSKNTKFVIGGKADSFNIKIKNGNNLVVDRDVSRIDKEFSIVVDNTGCAKVYVNITRKGSIILNDSIPFYCGE